MKLVKRKRSSVIGQCEKCNRKLTIGFDNIVDPRAPSLDLKSAVQCECGEYHNLIVGMKKKHTVTAPLPSRYQKEDTLKCPRCGSAHFHAGDKGFGLGKAVVGKAMVGPLGLLGGFIGHKKVMISCLKCGHKWQAGK